MVYEIWTQASLEYVAEHRKYIGKFTFVIDWGYVCLSFHTREKVLWIFHLVFNKYKKFIDLKNSITIARVGIKVVHFVI